MRKLIALLILLIACAAAPAQVAYIRKQVNGRVVVLTVRRETAERLKRHHATEADRKELQAALDWALGATETRPFVCIGHDTPHDVSRWLKCPVQNIVRENR